MPPSPLSLPLLPVLWPVPCPATKGWLALLCLGATGCVTRWSVCLSQGSSEILALPRGPPNGDVGGTSGAAAYSTPAPVFSPISQMVAACSPSARILEEQKARWAHFPGAPKPPCPWGCLDDVRPSHSCARRQRFSMSRLPSVWKGRGGDGQNVSPDFAAYLLWDLVRFTHPLDLCPCLVK